MKRIIAVVLLMGVCLLFCCGNSGCEVQPDPTSSYTKASEDNEKAVEKLIANDTLPQITESLERSNLKKRAEFINQKDRIGYLYLLTASGQLIKEVQVLGKVSSLNSYLTPMEEIKIIDSRGKVYSINDYDYSKAGVYSINSIVTVQASDVDGTYGENARGIFWFTPDGVYQEWLGGMSLYSSERLSFETKPVLVESVK